MDLRSVARALGGVVSGKQVLAPGPGHSPSDRSMSVWIDPQAPDLFRAHSHAGDPWQACRDYVKARLGLPDYHGNKDRTARRPDVSPNIGPGETQVPEVEKDTVPAALDIWKRSRAP